MQVNIKKKLVSPVKKQVEDTFLQRRQTAVQEKHEKTLNITKYQRNTNQNYNEVSAHDSQNGHDEKSLKTINAGEGVEQREVSYIVGENVDWYSHYGKQYQFSSVAQLCLAL